MRLINSKTLRSKAFIEQDAPPYAILSHTWGSQEVSAQELQQQTTETRTKDGWTKIVKCCKRAVDEHVDYVWIDTCCIDKTSSAELSEAINSMYRWYKSATVCYAYLSDVDSPTEPSQDLEDLLRSSRWFTRGWTLQELIAPIEIEFLSSSWELMGVKSGLARELSNITRIDEDVLLGNQQLSDVSIARRMSWYGARQTTRIEDTAYCLMGLFDVNMPMLYGEGEKAFLRLQEEIVRSSEDQTIFAWVDDSARDAALRGLLAPHPSCFLTTRDFRPVSLDSVDGDLIAVTNRGISLNLRQYRSEGQDHTAMLNCAEFNSLERFAFIHLQPVDRTNAKFARIKAGTLGRAARRGEMRPLIVKQKPQLIFDAQPMRGQQWFHIKAINLPPGRYHAGICLNYFTVSETSDIRGIDGTTTLRDSAQKYERVWVGVDPSKFFFKVPSTPNTVAVSLHISVEDPMGFGGSDHCKINIGVKNDINLAVSVIEMGLLNDGLNEKYSDTTVSFPNPVQVPGMTEMAMNSRQFEVATELSWEDIGGEPVACVTVNVLGSFD